MDVFINPKQNFKKIVLRSFRWDKERRDVHDTVKFKRGWEIVSGMAVPFWTGSYYKKAHLRMQLTPFNDAA